MGDTFSDDRTRVEPQRDTETTRTPSDEMSPAQDAAAAWRAYLLDLEMEPLRRPAAGGEDDEHDEDEPAELRNGDT